MPDEIPDLPPDLIEKLKNLDVNNPEDLNALFALSGELSAAAGLELPSPPSTDNQPEPEDPTPAYLAAADPTIPLPQFIQIVGSDPKQLINQQSLLFPACLTGSLDKVTWLLDQGLDPNHADHDSYTPLIYACLPGIDANFDLINLLLANGADPNAESTHGESPLRLVIRHGNYFAAHHLIASGADPERASFTPIHQAAASGNLNILNSLVSPATIESTTIRYLTPWLTALHADQVEAAEFLRSRGANIRPRNDFGEDALHLAASANATDSTRYLLGLGFNSQNPDKRLRTALHYAVESDCIDTATILLEAGANADALDEFEAAPVTSARSKSMLSLLHRFGADLNHTTGAEWWPLWNAVEQSDLPSVQWLIANGAAVNNTRTGEIALHMAMTRDHLEIIRLLIDAGADVNARDVDGDTPLIRSESTEAASLLLTHGADPTIPDMMGSLPADSSSLSPDIRAFIKSFPLNNQ